MSINPFSINITLLIISKGQRLCEGQAQGHEGGAIDEPVAE